MKVRRNSMTYRELLAALQELTDEELALDVTIFSEPEGEYYEGIDTDKTCQNDILDENYPVIIMGYGVGSL
jgi:hypothetical protein